MTERDAFGVALAGGQQRHVALLDGDVLHVDRRRRIAVMARELDHYVEFGWPTIFVIE